jgi:transcriptional regulator with XRE-family HTH domain
MSFFGKNIKKIRGVKKMSQQVFANLFDLKRATLGAYEERRSEPKIDTLIKVANHFSISIDDLLTKEITINQLLSFNIGITTDLNQVVQTTFSSVPFVNELNKDFFISEFPTSKSYQNLPTLQIPIKTEEGLLGFSVQDLMMVYKEEGLYPNDTVFGLSTSISEVKEGSVVIALWNDRLFVRRLQRSDTSYLFLADHVHIPPITVNKDDELFVWKVTSVLLNRYPNFASKLEDRIDTMNKQLQRIIKE